MRLYLDFVDEKECRIKNFWRWAILLTCGAVILFIVIACFFTSLARAEDYSDTQIVNAIWVIEGGAKARYAYGIRSVNYSTISEARQICFNTIRNNRKRFIRQDRYDDFLSFLASRYCPVTGNLSKAEKRLNKFWLGNLRKQLAKQGR
jgi:hypothetical protein